MLSSCMVTRGRHISERRSEFRQCQCIECREDPQSTTARVHAGLNRLVRTLDERSRRQLAGLWATQLGRGGVQQMSRITGLSRTTILRGQRELADDTLLDSDRVRAVGGGRKRAEKNSRAC
jgi:hypothetical protein